MKTRVKSALRVMLAAFVLFLLAAAWGALFAFPEPDATGDHAASLARHSSLSGWLMIVALCLFISGVLHAAWVALRKP